MKFFDGINHPSAATVAADGLDGAMLYLGTPSSGKDLTAAQYRDYKAHGLKTCVGFEHVASDWTGGAAAGRANGAAFLADARAKAVDVDDPFWVAIDEHVASSDLPTVVAYVRAFVATVRAGGWRGRAGGYGFPEVTTALHSAGVVDWYWGAGRRADQPQFVNVWQDNTQTILVGGSADDVDWVLIPIPTEETDVSLTNDDAQTIFTAPMPVDPAGPSAGHEVQAWQVWRDTLDRTGKIGGAVADVSDAVHGLDEHTSAQLASLADQISALGTQLGALAADVAALKAGQPAATLSGTAQVTVNLEPGSTA